MNKRQEYQQQSVFKRGIPEEKSVNKKKPLWMWVTVRREHSHSSWGAWMCFSLVDSRLLQATRLSNPLVQKMKSKLFMELLCSINTQVENKGGGNKKDMAHCMLIHLNIFGGPQVAYEQVFCQNVSVMHTGQPQVPKALGRSHSILPPTQLLGNWGRWARGVWLTGLWSECLQGSKASFLGSLPLPLTLSILSIISIPFPLPTISFMLQHQVWHVSAQVLPRDNSVLKANPEL